MNTRKNGNTKKNSTLSEVNTGCSPKSKPKNPYSKKIRVNTTPNRATGSSVHKKMNSLRRHKLDAIYALPQL